MSSENEGSSVSEGLEYKRYSESSNNPNCVRIQELRQNVEMVRNCFPGRTVYENRVNDIFRRCDEFCSNYNPENMIFVLLTDKDRYIAEFNKLEEDLLAVISELDQATGDSLRQIKLSNDVLPRLLSSERRNLQENIGINPFFLQGLDAGRETAKAVIYGPQFSTARQHYKTLIERSITTQRSFNLNPECIQIDIAKLLGSGGFAKVYAGFYQLAQPTPVAIKLLKKQKQAAESEDVSQQQEQDFFKEIGFQQALMGHSNILWYFGWTRLANPAGELQLALVTELCDQSLKTWIETSSSTFSSNALYELHALHILHGIASGMKHLSSSGILHCDLSINNILLKGHKPKIADFGLVGSKTGGTRGYIAPEVYYQRGYRMFIPLASLLSISSNEFLRGYLLD